MYFKNQIESKCNKKINKSEKKLSRKSSTVPYDIWSALGGFVLSWWIFVGSDLTEKFGLLLKLFKKVNFNSKVVS